MEQSMFCYQCEQAAGRKDFSDTLERFILSGINRFCSFRYLNCQLLRRGHTSIEAAVLSSDSVQKRPLRLLPRDQRRNSSESKPGVILDLCNISVKACGMF